MKNIARRMNRFKLNHLFSFTNLIIQLSLINHAYCQQNSENKPKLLTMETFREFILQNSVPTFVMYYAPWCSHCKRLSPIWEELAIKYNKDMSRVAIAKIDCTTQTELCSDNDILSYPTLMYYKNSVIDFERYEDQRNIESFERFIMSQLNGNIKIDSSNTANTIPNRPTTSVYELTDANFDSFVANGNHFIKFYAPWCSHCVHLAPTWKILAEKLKNANIKISHVDCTKNKDLCKRYRVDGYPTLLLFRNGKEISNYNGARTIQDFINFLSEMIEDLDTLPTQPNQESEVAPVTQNELIDLNSQNFGEVLQGNQYVFVKFYAPWCKHCRNLEPVWKELARRFTNYDPVSIARIDCNNNAEICMNYQIEGYPTLILFKNGERTQVYSGSRTIDDLFKFIETFIKSNKHDEF